MKQIKYIALAIFAILGFTSCDDDAWCKGDPNMEHVYYIGFEQWYNKSANDIKIDVPRGTTVDIPMQFWCEFVRPYDVVTYYWAVSSLVNGTDYEIVDDSGNVLQPDANGAYSITWPQAKKGVKNIHLKSLNGSKGSVKIQTLDPNSGVKITNQDIETTVQSRTGQYEVRIFTQNYFVTVNIE